MVSKHPLSLPGIYAITRISDGKVYIGQARKVSERFASHRRQLELGKHRNWPLQEAWIDGDPDDFSWALVCQPIGGHDPETMTHLEYEVMMAYPYRFNLNEPVQAYLGAHSSTRAKLSAERIKRWDDPGYKERLAIAHARHLAIPGNRERAAETMRATLADPEIQARRKERAALAWQREDVKAAQGAKTKAHWQDPAHRTKQRASRLSVWATLSPEQRQARVDAAAEGRRRARDLRADPFEGEVL